jgi:hypothetical protein
MYHIYIYIIYIYISYINIIYKYIYHNIYIYTNIIYIYTYVFNYEWILKFHEQIFMRFWTTSDFSMNPHVIDIDWTQWGYHFQRNPHMVHRLGWFNEWIIHFRPKRGFKPMNSFSMIWPMVFTAAKHHQTVAFPAKSANFPLTDSWWQIIYLSVWVLFLGASTRQFWKIFGSAFRNCHKLFSPTENYIYTVKWANNVSFSPIFASSKCDEYQPLHWVSSSNPSSISGLYKRLIQRL